MSKQQKPCTTDGDDEPMRTTFFLTKWLHDQVKLHSVVRKVPQAQVVREALNEWLDRRGRYELVRKPPTVS